ncbi:hypothetical protein CK510_21055 [Brunnivagina elsteri CCALA 953]|uniref:Uncharacterized protein n=2 Tax=Brunnivagina TaxID=3344733 RepID=A0A2A2TEP0_9CYAN|nr:hypothetical protein CK510_21055 [Calothrix elsteri CCALA 953]
MARIPLATLDDGGRVERGRRQEIRENKSSSTTEIIEAQGLVKTADGGIALVANATPSAGNTVPKCPPYHRP